jgi:hypothetical protein
MHSPSNTITSIEEKYDSKIIVGELHYFDRKHCRRCERYFISKKVFCQRQRCTVFYHDI